jgi:two-component system, OmpR family, alkaline phosphatase synthesis response regulator PhoP
MSRVLIVEDEEHLATGLRFNLEAEGYQVEVVDTGEAGIELLMETPQRFDVVVLDVMLPDKDGFTVVTELRHAGRFVPVLMLTARNRAEDVLLGFTAGADDYLPKPFELPILIARIRGLLRRTEWMRAVPRDRFVFAGKIIDFGALELHVGDNTLPLTLMEANLLRYLVQHEGKAVSRKAMLEEVWGVREDTDTRAIDNFIVRLRRYIEKEPANPRHLRTVRGVGYRFQAEPGD